MRRLVVGPAVAGLVTLSLIVAGLAAPAASAYGSAVPFTASATTAPADGTSTITLTFTNAYPTTSSLVRMDLAGATFGTASASSGIAPITPHQAWVLYPTTLAAGATLTIVAPKIVAPNPAGTATLAIYLVPHGQNLPSIEPMLDSVTQFTFTPVAPTQGPTQGTTVPSPRAHKVAFYKAPGSTCPTGAQPSTGSKAFGFAVVRVLPSRTVLVNVQLKHVMARATYDVWVNQDPGACPLASATKVGAVRTNHRGMGHAVLRVPYSAGATAIWVSVTNPKDASDFYSTKAAIVLK